MSSYLGPNIKQCVMMDEVLLWKKEITPQNYGCFVRDEITGLTGGLINIRLLCSAGGYASNI